MIIHRLLLYRVQKRMSMEFLMSETKVYAILTAGYDRKERMEGRILGEELELEVCSVLRKIREDM